jgi:hypothetical protein
MIHSDWRRWRKDYEKAWTYYKDYGLTWDLALYDLCKKYPCHSRKSNIAPKIGLIGRSYQSGLERHSKKGIDGIVNFLYNNRKMIDSVFDRLMKVKEPLTEAKLFKVVALHGEFLVILKKLTRGRASIRSFASKYMHFHCSAVPIFDNIAAGVISQKEWYPLTNRKIERFPMPPTADEVYYNYCVRFFALYRDLSKAGFRVGVKRLDHYLLWCNE